MYVVDWIPTGLADQKINKEEVIVILPGVPFN